MYVCMYTYIYRYVCVYIYTHKYTFVNVITVRTAKTPSKPLYHQAGQSLHLPSQVPNQA